MDESLFTVRMSILALFGLALGADGAAVVVSVADHRPADPAAGRGGARTCGKGRGRAGSVPASLLTRRDEVGALASALSDSAAALWARMDAIERFAADVAHEIKNPLSSIRSAIETLRRDRGSRRGSGSC